VTLHVGCDPTAPIALTGVPHDIILLGRLEAVKRKVKDLTSKLQEAEDQIAHECAQIVEHNTIAGNVID
jgi:hypothetical protein